MSTDQPFLVRYADIVFSLKTFAAAVLALVIALGMDLPRPYWAMATVYITSQPLAGATSSKAFYRVIGTLLGASATVAMVPNLVNAPELLCLLMALWLGVCLYLSLIDGTPRSYIFMLAGYTVALIGFPVVSDPASIFDTALARVEEITLGIICASLVSTLVFPRSVAPAVAARVDNWLFDARRLSQDVLSGCGAEQASRDRRLRLAADAVEIDALASHLAYDRLVDANAARGLRLLRLHMLMLLPLLASISDRIAALGDSLQTTQPELARLLDDLTRWIATDTHERQPVDRLRAAIAAQQPTLDAGASWRQIMTASLLIRLRELVDLSHDCRALRRAIATGDDASGVELAFRPEAGAALVRHRDHGMALWSAAGAMLAILICCGFWIATGWADGASAPMMAAVACSFFAAQDDPAPGIRGFTWWSIVSMAVVAVYLFAVLPRLPNVEMLIAMLAPSFLVFGILIARPATAFIGMALAANTASLLALQSTYSADFAPFANSGLSFVIGTAAAVIVTRLTRSVGAEWSARRLMSTNWTTLAVAAERRGQRDRAAFAGVMLNRLGLLAPRLAAIGDGDLRDADSLSELRVGLNIVDLRRARHMLAPRTLRAIDAMLDRLAAAFRGHDGGPMPPELLPSIDLALAEAMIESGDNVREDALIGLVGIRRGLFPDAPAYQPEAPDPARVRSVAA
ncbi:FUSC family protein [Bradyrhizobium canariense]|uniref:Uncharacterized membrane protein YccC n=1 Tax=Bradyrhizobium canariense TaxID=255045 RepID=A0A1H1VET7_9BRAD|nr:FUSC family protein [Bradyrhizobium canariense]SDS83308.1 Uncharacterized membrane protein YccC [Bradyrhizobium canariense]